MGVTIWDLTRSNGQKLENFVIFLSKITGRGLINTKRTNRFMYWRITIINSPYRDSKLESEPRLQPQSRESAEDEGIIGKQSVYKDAANQCVNLTLSLISFV